MKLSTIIILAIIIPMPYALDRIVDWQFGVNHERVDLIKETRQ